MRRYGALVGLVAVGLAAAVVILGARWHVEQQTRTVEVILDGAAWQEIAVREGRDPAAFLGRPPRPRRDLPRGLREHAADAAGTGTGLLPLRR